MGKKLQDLVAHADQLQRLGSLKKHEDYHLLVQRTSFLPHTASVAQRLWHIRSGTTEQPACKMCDSPAAWEKTNGGYYRKYCSNRCAVGDPDRLAKIQQTNQQRYKSRSSLGDPAIQAKAKATIRKRYGVSNVSQVPEINERRKAALRISKNKHLDRVDTIRQWIGQNLTQGEIGVQLGISQERVCALLKVLNLSTNTSTGSAIQREITEFIKSLTDEEIITDCSSLIAPNDVDIYIPALNIAFEIDGVYWHGESMGRGRNYHLNKTQQCAAHGIKLIHIFSSEWNTKKEIVKSRLAYILGATPTRVYARKCTVALIQSSAANQFVDNYHTQGRRPATINIGLFHGEDLISVMTFSNHTKYDYELVRFCSVNNVAVVGALGKMYKFFVDMFAPSSVLSYADKRWGDGQGYGNVGFVFEGSTEPNYYYFSKNGDTDKLHSRVRFQKHKQRGVLQTFDPLLTEWENMANNGYDRIWDCGSNRWVWAATITPPLHTADVSRHP